MVATAIAPVLNVYLKRRARINKEIRGRLSERRGIDITPRPEGSLIWLHAASVGETVSVLSVVDELVAFSHVLITTGTVTAAEMLSQRLPQLDLADRVLHRFAPLDVPVWVARFLDHWRPDVVVFVESELWPNQLWACRARGVPLMLLNGRMSAVSFAGWRRMPAFARETLGSFATIWARSDQDAVRFQMLGAPLVESRGDLKFAAEPLPFDRVALAALRAEVGDRPIWVAASTHVGEEAVIASLHAQLAERHPGLLTIIVPRHPDRGLMLSMELNIPRRSAGAGPDGGLWLADTLGEMGLWYRLANVVFVGRSLFAPGGGQNPLEPAHLARPIAVGPYTGNFDTHVTLLLQAGAIRVVSGSRELGDFVSEMLANPTRAQAMGGRAAAVTVRHGDMPRQAAEAIRCLIIQRHR